jgi:plastocyanin
MHRSAPEWHTQGLDYLETADAQDAHAAIRREKREPRAGLEPLSFWLIGIYCLAVFFAGFYFGRYSGGLTGDSLDPMESSQFATKYTSALRPSERMAELAHVSASSSAKARAPGIVKVVIHNMKFNPPTVEVKRGNAVEWQNDDLTPHTATSASFDSASIEPDKSWSYTFTEPDNVSYACTFHPEMKGTIIVR